MNPRLLVLFLCVANLGAPNQHDADHATFHRVKNFRSLALKLTPEPEE